MNLLWISLNLFDLQSLWPISWTENLQINVKTETRFGICFKYFHSASSQVSEAVSLRCVWNKFYAILAFLLNLLNRICEVHYHLLSKKISTWLFCCKSIILNACTDIYYSQSQRRLNVCQENNSWFFILPFHDSVDFDDSILNCTLIRGFSYFQVSLLAVRTLDWGDISKSFFFTL